VLVSPVTYAHRAKIADLAIKNRLAAIAPFNEFAEEGGLLSYGVSFATLFHYAAAHYVDRILRGARPADLPIEQPGSRTFHQPQNRKSARVDDPTFFSGRSRPLSRVKQHAVTTRG
jgi:putative tryptophan/tyrosine transport system substrate-binding protein